MKETGSAALALTAALITSSTFLPRACSSMYSWMLMLSFGEDRIGAVRRLVRRVVMGARRAVGAKAAEALIMNAAYEQSPRKKGKKFFLLFFIQKRRFEISRISHRNGSGSSSSFWGATKKHPSRASRPAHPQHARVRNAPWRSARRPGRPSPYSMWTARSPFPARCVENA